MRAQQISHLQSKINTFIAKLIHQFTLREKGGSSFVGVGDW